MLDTECFRDRVEAAAAAGATGLALDLPRYRAFRARGETDAELLAACRTSGVAVEEIWSYYGVLQAVDERRSDAILDRLLALADTFGARMIGAPSGFDGNVDEAAERLARACDRAAAYGIRLGLEFVAFTSLRDLATTWQVVAAAERDNVGIVLDCWHFFRGTPDLDLLARLPGRLLEAVQLNDGFLAPRAADPLEEVRRFRPPPGEGEFDLHRLVEVVHRIAPGVRYCVEVGTDEMDALPPQAAAIRAAEPCHELLAAARADEPDTENEHPGPEERKR